MRITTTTIENENYSQIFVEKNEMEQKKVKDEIEKLKKKGNKVAIFISGKEEMLQIIRNNIIYTFAKRRDKCIL